MNTRKSAKNASSEGLLSRDSNYCLLLCPGGRDCSPDFHASSDPLKEDVKNLLEVRAVLRL
jgi:hypothetical protein